LCREKKNILIYADKGVSESSFRETMKFFDCYVDRNLYNVIPVKGKYLASKNWEKKTQLLVVPGGADIPYDRALRGRGCTKIKKFVSSGGRYLGICAGAYFGCEKVEFALGTDLEVTEKRELKFFDGIAVGPILKDYTYDSEKGSCAADVEFIPLGMRFFSYYNGGCTFVEGRNSAKNYDVLATFRDRENLPAIIQCRVGQGIAILSGVHFEYDGESLDLKESDSSETSAIREAIGKTTHERGQVVEYILNVLLCIPHRGI
jgi:biotin--protein ligase